MWTAQQDAFRRKVADSEAENIVSTITLIVLFILSAIKHFWNFISHSSSSFFAATFDQTDEQRKEIVPTC